MRWPFHHRHKAKNIAAVPQTIQGIQLSSSAAGSVVPILYGQARVAGRLIHAESRSAIVPAGSTAADIANTQPIAMALCEGPITSVLAAWVDKDYLGPTDVAAVFASGLYYILFLGTPTQAAWAFLATYFAARAVPYQSTAYIANQYWPAGAGATLSNWSWEVKGLLPWGSGILDANPKDIVTDFLTNAIRGALFPTALLADLTPFRDYCTAAGIFLSPVFDTQRPAAEHLQEILAACNSEFVWSDGKLKVVPYADQAITGNGVTFTPNTTPLYDLTDNDFIADGQDPVRVVRRPQSDVYNMIQVEFDNRAKNYDGDIAPADDQVSIETYGLRPAPVIKAPFIKDAIVARLVARLALQRQVYIRNTYEFKLGIRYVLLEPMDLVTLTDANLGLNLTPVRLTQIVEEDDDTFTCTAEEWPFGIATATAYATVSGGAFSPVVPSSQIDSSLNGFRVIQEILPNGTYPFGALVYGWNRGSRVAEVWAGLVQFTNPLPLNPWDIVAGATQPPSGATVLLAMSPLAAGLDTLTIPKPPEGSVVYGQCEPRLIDLNVFGTVNQFVVNASPAQAPIIELDDLEFPTSVTQWIRIRERGLSVVSVLMRTQVGKEPISALAPPTRSAPAGSVVKGGLLSDTGVAGSRVFEIEQDGTRDFVRNAYIDGEVHLSNGQVMALGPFIYDWDTNPNILAVDLATTTLSILCDTDTKSIRVFDKLGTWEYVLDGLSATIDVSKMGTNGVAGMGAGASSTFTVQARSEPTAYVDGSTLIATRDIVISGISAPPATALWDSPGVSAQAPPLLSSFMTVKLKATGAPVGWTVKLWMGLNVPAIDETTVVTPVLSAPPTVETTYSFDTSYVATNSPPRFFRSFYARADLIDNLGVVVDSRTVHASWYSANAS